MTKKMRGKLFQSIVGSSEPACPHARIGGGVASGARVSVLLVIVIVAALVIRFLSLVKFHMLVVQLDKKEEKVALLGTQNTSPLYALVLIL